MPPSKKRSRTTSRKTKADQARADRARLILTGIRRLLKRRAQDGHRIGQQLAKIHDLHLYDALGYRTFEAMLRGEKLMSRAQAYRLMAVAHHYSRAQLRELGVEKAHALLTFVNTTPEDDIAALLVESDALIGGKPISESSARHIKRSIRELKAEHPPPRETPATANRVARALEAALEYRGARDHRVRPRLAAGEWIVDVRLSLDDALLLAKQ